MKTINKTILTAILLLAATAIYAQDPLTFGIKAGMNFSDFSKDIKQNDIKVGFNAGVTVDYKLNKHLYLLSGIEAASKGTKVKDRYHIIEGEGSAADYGKLEEKWNPIYLQVPVHFGAIVEAYEDMVILFHAGPFLSYGIAGKVTIEEEGQPKETINAFGSNGLLKRWDFGMGLGVGFEFKRMGINFGYDLGMLNISKESGRSLKTNNVNVTFSYRFQ